MTTAARSSVLLALALAACAEASDSEGPKTGGPRYPFPQSFRSDRCRLPATANATHARTAYDAWKNDLVTTEGAGGFRRVRRPNSFGAQVNSTVSEGIAYGMELAVFADDQALFDDLWKYSQLWVNANGLMDWYINAEGTMRLGTGGATDSDEDIAWALVMAAEQWGGRGSLDKDYLELAKEQIDRVWRFEVDKENGYVLRPGDQFGGANLTNPSYFAPAYYRVFAAVTNNPDWMRVVDSSYRVIDASLNATNGNVTNGLVPAWCDAEGAMIKWNGADNYQLDSCRTPFRIGQDWCYFGEARAKAYLDKVSAFFAGVGAANIVDGYEMDGRPRPQFSMDGSQAASFVGTAAVGAMSDPRFSAFVDEAYGRVMTLELIAGSHYYQKSWTGLTVFMMTGNLHDFTLR